MPIRAEVKARHAIFREHRACITNQPTTPLQTICICMFLRPNNTACLPVSSSPVYITPRKRVSAVEAFSSPIGLTRWQWFCISKIVQRPFHLAAYMNVCLNLSSSASTGWKITECHHAALGTYQPIHVQLTGKIHHMWWECEICHEILFLANILDHFRQVDDRRREDVIIRMSAYRQRLELWVWQICAQPTWQPHQIMS